MCVNKKELGVAATLKEVETMLDATKFRAMMDEVIVFLSEWLERHLKIVYGNINWNAHIYSMLSPDQQKFATESGASSLDRLDLSALISVFVGNFVVLRKKFQLDADLKSMALTAKTLRNVDSHRTAKDIKTLTEDKLQYRLLSLKTLLVGLRADESVVKKIASVTTERGGACVGKPKAASNPLPGTVIKHSGITIKVPSTPVVVKQTKKASEPCDTKRYPQTVQDRINARQITGFHVETVYGAEAKGLYDACNASSAGYDLVAVQFAIVAKRSADSAFSLEDVKSKLDRGFVGLIPDFRNAIISQSHGAIIWFFGSNGHESAESTSEPITLVNPPASTSTTIPQWFQKEIHSNGLPYLSADEVQTTMGLSERDVERYAKTYAPRSFAEGVSAGRNLPSEFRMAAEESGYISMLDVGCGTAAFSLGVIHGFDRIIDKVCEPKLDLVDGNPAMIAKARAFFLSRETSRTYGVPMVRTEWFEREIMKVSDCFPKATYDLIVTSKFLGELVCRGMKDVYSAFFKDAIQHLNPGGQMVLVDVPKHREQIEQAIKIIEKKVGNVVVRDVTAQPRFVGSESTDSEIVMLVQISK